MAKILVVDDDLEIGFMLKLMLEHQGYTVIVSQRTEKIEELIISFEINLVILDMLIAGVKGTDVCMLLKKDPLTSAIPIIMITALPDANKICIEAGADDFLSKPFEMQNIFSKVENVLNKKKSFSSD